MAKVYVVFHGQQCIPHRFGASSYNREDLKDIYDSEEKAIDHIRKNSENRIKLLSSQDRYDEYSTIIDVRDGERAVYARTSDDRVTETAYYIYKSYEVK